MLGVFDDILGTVERGARAYVNTEIALRNARTRGRIDELLAEAELNQTRALLHRASATEPSRPPDRQAQREVYYSWLFGGGDATLRGVSPLLLIGGGLVLFALLVR